MSSASMACPYDGRTVAPSPNGMLACSAGHQFPIIDGIPVLLRDDVDATIGLLGASVATAKRLQASGDSRGDGIYLETVGVSDAERAVARKLLADPHAAVDPIASVLVGATNGYTYEGLIGRLASYPIPDIDLPPGNGKLLLDVGCSWGRWSIAAARKGYRVVGVDPSLGAVAAARRVAAQLGVANTYIVGDARYLPFASAAFDVVYSYSVLQHFSRGDARLALQQMARVLQPAGTCKVQMAHSIGIRSLYHQLRRGFREPRDFDVRYWSLRDLRAAYLDYFTTARIEAHAFGGLGFETTNLAMLPTMTRAHIKTSNRMVAASQSLPALTRIADSVWIVATKAGVDAAAS